MLGPCVKPAAAHW